MEVAVFGMRRGRRCGAVSGFTLSDMPEGGKAKIYSFAGGRGCREKMTSMGLFPGTEITVVHSHGENGMMLVSVGSTRLMVDRHMASRVLVEKVS